MKATLRIYGDIIDDSMENGVSPLQIAYELEQLGEVDEIDVHISSYGGSVSAGLSIYNQLKNHPAKIITHADGICASVASVIFLAGDERLVNETSLLMIHSPWVCTMGNAKDLRAEANTLDQIEKASLNIYCTVTGESEETIKSMLDAETWLDCKQCIELGFATGSEEEQDEVVNVVVQSVKRSLVSRIVGGENPQQKEQEPVDSNVSTVDSLSNFIKIFQRKGEQ